MGEWVLDRYASDWYTTNGNCDNCANLVTGVYRVSKGSTFWANLDYLRAAERGEVPLDQQREDRGFRCAYSP